ncbi:MAG: hypothetical protein ACKVHP_16595, partial [Verrucomicrobiales bacterium]
GPSMSIIALTENPLTEGDPNSKSDVCVCVCLDSEIDPAAGLVCDGINLSIGGFSSWSMKAALAAQEPTIALSPTKLISASRNSKISKIC